MRKDSLGRLTVAIGVGNVSNAAGNDVSTDIDRDDFEPVLFRIENASRIVQPAVSRFALQLQFVAVGFRFECLPARGTSCIDPGQLEQPQRTEGTAAQIARGARIALHVAEDILDLRIAANLDFGRVGNKRVLGAVRQIVLQEHLVGIGARKLGVALDSTREETGASRAVVRAVNCGQRVGQHRARGIGRMRGAIADELGRRVTRYRRQRVVVEDAANAFAAPYPVMLENRDVLDCLGRREQNGRAARTAVLVAQRIAGVDVGDIAVTASSIERQTDGQLVLDDRQIDSCLHLAEFARCAAQDHIAAKVVTGHRRGIKHSAARGIAAEQRALRPLQHLDRTQIEECRGGVSGVVRRFVEVRQNGRAGARERIERLPAHGIAELVRILAVLDLKAWNQRTDILLAGDVAGLKRFCSVGNDRHRNLGQLFLAALRRDNDVLRADFLRGLFLSGLRQNRRGHGGNDYGNRTCSAAQQSAFARP